MRRAERTGNFLLYLLLNLLLNIEWSIPAWILLALHFILGWPLWPFFAALGAWILWLLITMGLLGLVSRIANADEPKTKNKNPYSQKTVDILPKDSNGSDNGC